MSKMTAGSCTRTVRMDSAQGLLPGEKGRTVCKSRTCRLGVSEMVCRLAKISAMRPRVMENGIKSPSLSCGTGAAARDRGLNPTRSRAEHSATSFRSGSEDALSASAIPDGERRAPVSYPEPS